MLTNDDIDQSYLVTHGNHVWNYGQTEGKKTFHPEQAQATTCLKDVQYCIITMQWVSHGDLGTEVHATCGNAWEQSLTHFGWA